MAIAFDAATDGGHNAGLTNSLTYAHTCTGSDLFLRVAVIGDLTTGADDVTGVTYNGVAMTLVRKIISIASFRCTYDFELFGASVGTHNVVVSSTTNHYLLSGCASYTGVAAPRDADDSTTSASDADGSLTKALTTTADNCWVLLMSAGFDGANDPPSAGVGVTRRTYDHAFGTWGLFDSNSAITPAGSYSTTWTYPVMPCDMLSIVMSVAPPAAAGKRFFLVPS
jgi:hypothetical protein